MRLAGISSGPRGHRQRGPRGSNVDSARLTSPRQAPANQAQPTPPGVFAGNAGDPQSYDLQKDHRTIIVGTPDTVIEQSDLGGGETQPRDTC